MHTKTRQSHSSYPRITQWALSHLRAFQFALRECVRTPLSHFVTVCVIGVAIALPLGFFVVMKNLQLLNFVWSANAPTISLYLQPNATHLEVHNLMQTLERDPRIATATYISPAQGLKTFEKNTPFRDVLKLFPNNPIPGVITILPTKENQLPDAINALYLSLKEMPSVDMGQLDLSWITRLHDIISIGKQITKGLSLLFGFGVILIIGHTLRASLSSHLTEVQVMRLLGATNGYIRRPLLYRGILYGVLGGIVAWIFINLLLMHLEKPITQLAATYHSPFVLHTVSAGLGFHLLLLSGFAGLLSAWLITTQFLNHPEQTD